MEYLFFPILSGFIAQVLKIFTKSTKIEWKNIISYSGMPSGHSALVVSLATIIGFKNGFFSSVFAISFILAIIVVRDAVGIRRYIEQHGKTLNVLVKDLRDDNVLDKRYPHLLEHIGHTPAQVLVGSLIGFLVSLLGYLFM